MIPRLQRWTYSIVAFFALIMLCATAVCTASETRKTENVIFVMTDGLRWQEVFGGVEAGILNDPKYVAKENTANVKKQFERATPEASREALMPFLWKIIAKDGQVFGNRNKRSSAQVTNGLKFSYPGYSETLCGFVDPKIDKNDYGPNPNVTVLEWLHRKPAFRGRVAAFGEWSVFNDIFNRSRCGFCVNAGFDPLTEIRSPQVELLNQLKAETPRAWGNEPYDSFTFHTALEYFKAKRPRVFFLSLGETDEWAHSSKYDEYLTAARRADHYARTLWDLAQTMPEYRGKTPWFSSPDPGRGAGGH
jgi:hypothetical protein